MKEGCDGKREEDLVEMKDGVLCEEVDKLNTLSDTSTK